MSLINDALKRAEQEKRSRSAPPAESAPATAACERPEGRSRLPVWAVLLGTAAPAVILAAWIVWGLAGRPVVPQPAAGAQDQPSRAAGTAGPDETAALPEARAALMADTTAGVSAMALAEAPDGPEMDVAAAWAAVPDQPYQSLIPSPAPTVAGVQPGPVGFIDADAPSSRPSGDVIAGPAAPPASGESEGPSTRPFFGEAAAAGQPTTGPAADPAPTAAAQAPAASQPAATRPASESAPEVAARGKVSEADFMLMGVMRGPVGATAIVSGNFFSVGQRIVGAKVTRIGTYTVELEIEGRRVSLGM